ncbi:endothiapepsin-like protein [Metarhizium album ARSEF 1941]|uniref:Endothiapepsin-like protein n=1 Tax=Metarhizium album (strain ARSEF 1941) TaxID=1081103 RepID=A0A0B2WSY0_METAS|nr:endothiapepsin-like protein [Metarhizium album ARSEF 1941]KHN99176.1 endothiapepsin-like protein [Metarhizium album ARSEF 1941]
MRTHLVLSAAFVAASLGAAVPLKNNGSGHFSLIAKARPRGSRDFLRDWKAAHRRWGKKHLLPASKATLDGGWFSPALQHRWCVSMAKLVVEASVTAEPLLRDQAYVMDVEFGTPAQKLKMMFDTGSSDLWVKSTDTIYSTHKEGPRPPQYAPGNSSTSTLVDKAKWSIQYLDNSAASGIVYRDTLRLGDFEIRNVPVESALTMSPELEEETSVSGIMGLAKQLPNNISPPTASFLSLLRSQLKAPVFTVDLRRNATSRFDFGYINESMATENITWLDSNPLSDHWEVELDRTAWLGKSFTWVYHKFQATVDTGTSLLFLPEPLARRYWAAVPSAKKDELFDAYAFSCKYSEKLPDLLFKLPKSEHLIRIPGRYLNYGPLESEPSICWGGMQSDLDLSATILGDVMLKALFVAFDVDKNRVGFANKVLHDVL